MRTSHSLKSRYSIIHRSPNDSTLYKSSIALRIIQRSTKFQRYINHSKSHKFCKEVKNNSTLYKSFNVIQIIHVVQIIQRCTTNNSTLCKSCNVVQVIQRSTNHSTENKSFNAIQIIQRSTNHSTQYKLFK